MRLSILLLSLVSAGCAAAGRSHVDSVSGAHHEITGDYASSLRLARAARSAGDLASAINLYRSVIAKHPEDSTLLVELADTLTDAGSLDDAIGIYQQVKPGSPGQMSALLGLSRIYLELNDATKALDYVMKAQAIAPNDPRVLIRRGVALDSLSRHAEAQQCYRTILLRTPRSVSARNDLALSLALSAKFDEAIAILGPMARSSDASPQIRQNLAFIYGLKGDDKDAAAFSKVDLSAEKVQANLRFFDYAREQRAQ